jgi:hypothetical protein
VGPLGCGVSGERELGLALGHAEGGKESWAAGLGLGCHLGFGLVWGLGFFSYFLSLF